MLLGPSEIAVRLPLIGFVGLLMVTIAGAVGRGCSRPLSKPLWGFLAGALLFAVTLLVSYGGQDRYVADAAVGATYVFLTLLVLLQWYALEQRHGWLFIVLAGLAVTTRYWALILSLGLLTAAWWTRPTDRAWVGVVARRLAIALGATAAAALAIGWRRGDLPVWAATLWNASHDVGRPPWAHLRAVAGFCRQWILLAGIVSIGGLLGIRRLPAAGRRLGIATLAFGGFLAGLDPARTFHPQVMLGFLTMVTGAVWMRQMPPRRQRVVASISTIIVAGLLTLAWPRGATISTDNRTLGRQTCFLTSRYEEAMAWSRIAIPLYERGQLGWPIDYSAWVQYAAITDHPARPFLYYVAGRPVPPVPGAVLVAATADGTACFAATPEAAQTLRRWTPPQRPRCSWLRD